MDEHPNGEFEFNHRTMQVSVADHLRSLILSRQLKSGERLVQTELAERLGVSRTPIREALQKLASEGLVTFSPYKSATVAKLSLADAEDIYSVRIALESHAGCLAAQRITEEELDHLEALLHQMEEAFKQGKLSQMMEINRQFNSALFSASQQPRLNELATKYMHLADLYRRIHFSVERLAADCVVEHRALLAALRERDSEAVETLTRDQIERSVAALRDYIGND